MSDDAKQDLMVTPGGAGKSGAIGLSLYSDPVDDEDDESGSVVVFETVPAPMATSQMKGVVFLSDGDQERDEDEGGVLDPEQLAAAKAALSSAGRGLATTAASAGKLAQWMGKKAGTLAKQGTDLASRAADPSPERIHARQVKQAQVAESAARAKADADVKKAKRVAEKAELRARGKREGLRVNALKISVGLALVMAAVVGGVLVYRHFDAPSQNVPIDKVSPSPVVTSLPKANTPIVPATIVKPAPPVAPAIMPPPVSTPAVVAPTPVATHVPVAAAPVPTAKSAPVPAQPSKAPAAAVTKVKPAPVHRSAARRAVSAPPNTSDQSQKIDAWFRKLNGQ